MNRFLKNNNNMNKILNNRSSIYLKNNLCKFNKIKVKTELLKIINISRFLWIILIYLINILVNHILIIIIMKVYNKIMIKILNIKEGIERFLFIINHKFNLSIKKCRITNSFLSLINLKISNAISLYGTFKIYYKNN